MLGFTADKTLKIAQSLYETRKALTYPRTDSRYLPDDMIPRVVKTMHQLPNEYQKLVPGALPGGKLPVSNRTVDASKVTDHHALIPTDHTVKLSTFSEDERQLYDLVARRMLAAFYPAYEYDATKVITEVNGHSFRTNGQVVVNEGFKAVPPLANPPKARKKAKQDEVTALPPLAKGMERDVIKVTLKNDKTKPPVPHTDASLLAAMETAGKDSDDEEIVRQMKGSGIGTPATRASIIERIISVGYAMRKGKNIEPTEKGMRLISIMPQEIASAETTGRWEKALDEISDGKQNPDRFLESIRRFSSFLTKYALENKQEVDLLDPAQRKARARRLTNSGTAVDGCTCPVCGKGAVLETSRSYCCSRLSEGCHFTIWKDCLVRGGGP